MSIPVTSPLVAMRDLTHKIDSTVEALLDAHEFQLTELASTESGACAGFTRKSNDPRQAAWTISLNIQPTGTAEVRLMEEPETSARLSIRIRLSADDKVTLPQTIGLAISFLDFAQQLGLG